MNANAMSSPKVIRWLAGGPQVVADRWRVLRDAPDGMAAPGAGVVMPLPLFLALDDTAAASVRAVWIAPGDEFEEAAPRLLRLDMIAIDFPDFRDGRGYSIARLLRTRHGWKGELRAIGDVLRDQLNYMRRCGFDAFAVRADKDIDDALKSFGFYSVNYQGGADEPAPLFRRRRPGPPTGEFEEK